MKVVIENFPSTAYWRIYCRATERGRSVNDEIVATLNAGNSEIAPDPEARLAAARQLRQRVVAVEKAS